MSRTETSTKTTVRSLQAALAAEGHQLSYTAACRVWEATSAPTSRWIPVLRDEISWDPDVDGHLMITGTDNDSMSMLLNDFVRHPSDGIEVIHMHTHGGAVVLPVPVMERMLRPLEELSDTMVVILDDDLSFHLRNMEDALSRHEVDRLVRVGANTRTYFLTYTSDPGCLPEELRMKSSIIALPDSDESIRQTLKISERDADLWQEGRSLASFAS